MTKMPNSWPVSWPLFRSSSFSARLTEAEPEQLERWAERLLEVETLEALFDG